MTQKTFLGIEIDGDIRYAEHRAVQRPVEEFGPVLQAVLDDPHFEALGWQQYTPYFNDGEPCVFSASTVWVRTSDPQDADLSPDSLSVDYGSGALETQEWVTRGWHPKAGLEQWQLDLRLKAEALNSAVEGGEFDDVLLAAFGDHADITVTRGGIKVEYYRHD